jgi:hypothetical protein
LRPKFERELRPGVRIVSRCHAIPGWTPVTYDSAADVYLYRWPDSASPAVDAGGDPVAPTLSTTGVDLPSPG